MLLFFQCVHFSAINCWISFALVSVFMAPVPLTIFILKRSRKRQTDIQHISDGACNCHFHAIDGDQFGHSLSPIQERRLWNLRHGLERTDRTLLSSSNARMGVCIFLHQFRTRSLSVQRKANYDHDVWTCGLAIYHAKYFVSSSYLGPYCCFRWTRMDRYPISWVCIYDWKNSNL